MGKGGVICLSSCFGVLFVIAAGLVGGSFQMVDPYSYGLAYNTVSKTIDASRVYTSGRYFLGLAHAFFLFPRGWTNVYYGTEDGGADSGPLIVTLPSGTVTVEMSFQYSLRRDKLAEIYQNFALSYHTRFVSIASSTLTNGIQQANFTIQTFYTNRTAVTDYMSLILTRAMLTQNAIVNSVQLRRVRLPAATEGQIVTKLVSAQLTQTANNVQKQQDVVANTTVQVGQINQQVQLFSANQTQIAIQITQSAAAQAKQIQLSAAAVAYSTFRRLSGFSPDQLLQFLSFQNMRQLASAEVAIGFTAGVTPYLR